MVYVTKHAEDRTKERIGIPKRGAQRTADMAMEKGLTHAEATGKLKRLITESFRSNRTANNIRIYHGYLYVFAGNTLITVFRVPKDFQKAALAQENRKKQRIAAATVRA